MKVMFKVTAVILLLAITFISISTVEGATKSVTIEGVGQPTVTRDNNGSYTWECKDTSTNKCTITIVFQV